MESYRKDLFADTDSLVIDKLNSTDTVLYLIKALNSEDLETARELIADNFSFEGVLGSRDGAEAYLKDMEKMKLKYDIKNVFTNGNDVCLLYDLAIDGKTIFGCGLYHVQNGKVMRLRVVFDPRPLINKEH
jgi:limonene-1,2-epoxide hydrolase